MIARKTPDLNNYFSAAKQSQQLSEAEAEIQRLTSEIEELRSQGAVELETQLQALREQLRAQTGILSIALDSIEPNPSQPRQTFLPESIESMKRSLTNDGQLEPIILIERENLLIFDGERRWRSARALGWEHLQAVIIPEPEALHRKALLTSLHREDLNPLDKAEAIVREITNNTGLPSNDLPRILSTAVRRLNKQKRMNQVNELLTATPIEQEQGLKTLDLDEKEQLVLGQLFSLQLNPASVDANIFPMLSLAEDLKQAIRTLGLKGVHAMALQTLSDKSLGVSVDEAYSVRVDATQRVISKNLSAIQTRKLVADIKKEYGITPLKITCGKQIQKAKGSLEKLDTDLLNQADRNELVELESILHCKLEEIGIILQAKQ